MLMASVQPERGQNEVNPYERIGTLAASMQEELTAVRRDLHRYPETGWLEMRTTVRIVKRLKELGYTVLAGRGSLL